MREGLLSIIVVIILSLLSYYSEHLIIASILVTIFAVL